MLDLRRGWRLAPVWSFICCDTTQRRGGHHSKRGATLKERGGLHSKTGAGQKPKSSIFIWSHTGHLVWRGSRFAYHQSWSTCWSFWKWTRSHHRPQPYYIFKLKTAINFLHHTLQILHQKRYIRNMQFNILTYSKAKLSPTHSSFRIVLDPERDLKSFHCKMKLSLACK